MSKAAASSPKGQQNALSSRDQLVAMAAKLFSVKGYNKTNMRELAESVGMKAGSIFYHFKGKEDILYAVMHHSISLLAEAVQREINETDTTQDRLRTLVRIELESYLGEQSSFAMVLIHEWRNLPEEQQAKLLLMRGEYEAVWLTVLGDYHQAGMIKADPNIVRRMLNGAFSWVIHWYNSDGKYNLEQLVDEVMLMLVTEKADSLP